MIPTRTTKNFGLVKNDRSPKASYFRRAKGDRPFSRHANSAPVDQSASIESDEFSQKEGLGPHHVTHLPAPICNRERSLSGE